LVSLCVHIFSIDYMHADPHFIKFMSYLSLFTCLMIFFIVSGNLVQLFLGWEGVGLASYLLINF
jgi:NADH:ubiquinone oxidoreductase subunit 5 (subunit L)/multisubunit Na+/H+ antiporter MnhA subunit